MLPRPFEEAEAEAEAEGARAAAAAERRKVSSSSSSSSPTLRGPTRPLQQPRRPLRTRRCLTGTLRQEAAGAAREAEEEEEEELLLRRLLSPLFPFRLRLLLLLLRGLRPRMRGCTGGLTDKFEREGERERRERLRVTKNHFPFLFQKRKKRKKREKKLFFTLPLQVTPCLFFHPSSTSPPRTMARFLAFVYALAVAVVLSASPSSAASSSR